jgi:tetratricopeptide (TPR) repeat protein
MPSPRLPLLFVAALLAAPDAFAATTCSHEHVATPAAANPTLGAIEFPTSTRNPAAQAAFERGMLWLHLFEYPHAALEFRQAQALDPDLALAYWGEAMTYTHALWNQDEPGPARAALARFGATPQARAARAGSDRERAFLDTAEKLFGPGPIAERDADFLTATDALARAYPDDDEAQLLHALALLGVTRGVRHTENYLQAADIAKAVLARQPSHPGAAHYWIHGMDEPAHAAGALEPATVLARIAPDAGHAQHMTSHIFLALGRWQDVAAANESAIRVTDAELRAGDLPAFTCGHYNEWLHYAYHQLGRPRAAQAILDACAADGAAAVAWMRGTGKPFRSIRDPAVLQSRWHDSMVVMRSAAVVASAPNRAANAALSIDTADIARVAGWDAFARGFAAADAGDVAAAQAALEQLRAATIVPPGMGEQPNITQHLAILERMLVAAMAHARGDLATALSEIEVAGAAYEALPVDFGPPTPVKPPQELAGEWLLAAGRPAEAVLAFDRALALAPGRALSVLGRARALAASGDGAGAREAYAVLADIWRDAEPDLPALAEVRAGATKAE